MAEVFAVKGPYHYEHDTHPCLTVSSDERIVAAVYITDSNEERAQQEAEEVAECIKRLHDSNWRALSASEVAGYKWPDDTAEHRSLRAAFVEGAALNTAAVTEGQRDGSRKNVR